ncbi:MinD/ParA family protein [Paenibacillus sp. MER 180]|uniref:MinD/ParA family protein n=1 Tax=Paenibacillus popilliae TaxID=78057 RepID=A0ABY3AX95_PAEPP|nr:MULTISPECIES: MinD/ParA family protein [unclassified Paenibacillus]MCM3291701.1 MinD/ParA family protein [Paenibacillus sp. MER 180]TQR45812.1 MinD/ParA family protein [Paenibacillus sp. SDF0028]
MSYDQAEGLRQLVESRHERVGSTVSSRMAQGSSEVRSARIIAVTSGKGGVGKSNFTLNFALSLQDAGYRTLVFDADIGMGNIDVLLGATSGVSLMHVLRDGHSLQDIIQVGPRGMHYIPGGSGFQELLDMPSVHIEHFIQEMEKWSSQYDVILFDTGAGLSKETMQFLSAADETLVVTTPEPTSIADAYALIKVVSAARPDHSFRLVINRASDWKEGSQTAERLSTVAERFLNRPIPTLGILYDDPHVMQAVKRQIPFAILYPQCIVAKQLRELANAYIHGIGQTGQAGGVKQFLRKWLGRWSS